MTKARAKPAAPGEVRQYSRVSPAEWDLIFKHVAVAGSLAAATRTVLGPERNQSVVHYALRRDVLLQKRLANAEADFRQVLLGELIRRGVHGVDEAIYHKGDVVGFRKVYSDQALLAACRHYIELLGWTSGVRRTFEFMVPARKATLFFR